MNKRAFRDKERQLRAAMNMSQAGIFATESNRWNITFANKQMAELFGCTLSELSGTAFIDYIHSTDIKHVLIDMHKLVTGEIEEVTSEVHFIRRDGVDFWGYFSAARLTRDDGSLQGMMVTIYD